MDDVELAAPGRQQAPGPEGEGPGLGEARRAHDRELEHVAGVGELTGVRYPERVGVAVQVEPGYRGEARAVVEHRPRLPGEHLHRVTEPDELTGQVARVHPLAAAARVAPVDQVGDAQTAGLRRCRRAGGGDFEVGAALPRRPDLEPALPGALRHAMR